MIQFRSPGMLGMVTCAVLRHTISMEPARKIASNDELRAIAEAGTGFVVDPFNRRWHLATCPHIHKMTTGQPKWFAASSAAMDLYLQQRHAQYPGAQPILACTTCGSRARLAPSPDAELSTSLQATCRPEEHVVQMKKAPAPIKESPSHAAGELEQSSLSGPQLRGTEGQAKFRPEAIRAAWIAGWFAIAAAIVGSVVSAFLTNGFGLFAASRAAGTGLSPTFSSSDSSGAGSGRSAGAVERTGTPLGRLFRDPAANGAYAGIAFSPDGRTLAAADGNGHVYLWTVPTGKLAAALSAPKHESGGVLDVAVSPDGSTLAAADGNGRVYLWNVATRELMFTLDMASGPVNVVAFSPMNGILASAAGSDVYLWNLATRRQTAMFVDKAGLNVSAVAFSRNGEIVAISDWGNQVYLWNLARSRSSNHSDGGSRAGVASLAFGKNGRLVAAADGNGSVYLWDALTGRLITELRGPSHKGLYGAAFQGNGTILAAADTAGHVYIWNVATRKLITTFYDKFTGAQTIAFSQDGRILAAHYAGQTVLWNTSTAGKISDSGAPRAVNYIWLPKP